MNFLFLNYFLIFFSTGYSHANNQLRGGFRRKTQLIQNNQRKYYNKISLKKEIKEKLGNDNKDDAGSRRFGDYNHIINQTFKHPFQPTYQSTHKSNKSKVSQRKYLKRRFIRIQRLRSIYLRRLKHLSREREKLFSKYQRYYSGHGIGQLRTSPHASQVSKQHPLKDDTAVIEQIKKKQNKFYNRLLQNRSEKKPKKWLKRGRKLRKKYKQFYLKKKLHNESMRDFNRKYVIKNYYNLRNLKTKKKKSSAKKIFNKKKQKSREETFTRTEIISLEEKIRKAGKKFSKTNTRTRQCESHEPFLIDVINLKIHPFTKAYDHHTQPLKLSFAINITRDLPQNIHLQISLFRIKSSETIQIPCYSIFGDCYFEDLCGLLENLWNIPSSPSFQPTQLPNEPSQYSISTDSNVLYTTKYTTAINNFQSDNVSKVKDQKKILTYDKSPLRKIQNKSFEEHSLTKNFYIISKKNKPAQTFPPPSNHSTYHPPISLIINKTISPLISSIFSKTSKHLNTRAQKQLKPLKPSDTFHCPRLLRRQGVPCRCPFKKGFYQLNNYPILPVSFQKLFYFLIKGNYEIRLKLVTGDGHTLGCIKTQFSIPHQHH